MQLAIFFMNARQKNLVADSIPLIHCPGIRIGIGNRKHLTAIFAIQHFNSKVLLSLPINVFKLISLLNGFFVMYLFNFCQWSLIKSLIMKGKQQRTQPNNQQDQKLPCKTGRTL